MFSLPHINSISQYKTAISRKAYAVLYIYARCSACGLMMPIVERISNSRRMSEDIKFYKMDANAGWGGLNKLLQDLKIEAYPTTLIFRQNEIVVQGLGYKPLKPFEEWLSFHTSPEKATIKSCRIVEVTKDESINKSSPLIYCDSLKDIDSYMNSPKPAFLTISIPGTPYHRPLEVLLQRTALSQANDATHILFSLNDRVS
ncbi:hypothetical protein BDQ17DRAFT_1359622 [Cyathus striatus]|nr:hypothetical protein BDQ17DRAFT_1359622 [Cyathus striatus]